MKNIFGVNVTKGQEESGVDGKQFGVRSLNESQMDGFYTVKALYAKLKKKSELPTVFIIVASVCLILGVAFLGCLIAADISYEQGYENAPLLFWLSGGALIVWLAVFVWSKIHRAVFLQSQEYKKICVELEQVENQLRATLAIPPSFAQIDALIEMYVVKNGEKKRKNIWGLGEYFSLHVCAFVEDGNLCISDYQCVWAIPLASLKNVTISDKKARIIDINPSPLKRKKRRLKQNQNDQFTAKYYKVTIEGDEGFYLLVPEYDGETLTALTGLRPQTYQDIAL